MHCKHDLRQKTNTNRAHSFHIDRPAVAMAVHDPVGAAFPCRHAYVTCCIERLRLAVPFPLMFHQNVDADLLLRSVPGDPLATRVRGDRLPGMPDGSKGCGMHRMFMSDLRSMALTRMMHTCYRFLAYSFVCTEALIGRSYAWQRPMFPESVANKSPASSSRRFMHIGSDV